MAAGRVAVVPDRHGTGTNALLLAPADAIGPAFGEGSAERHRDRAARAGHEVAIEALASLALDLDTPDDLDGARRGARRASPSARPSTAAALARLGPIARRAGVSARLEVVALDRPAGGRPRATGSAS